MVENKPRCGMCNCEWTEGHEKTAKHLRLKAKFDDLKPIRLVNQEVGKDLFEKAIKEEEIAEYEDTTIFKDLDMAYCVVEIYDYGSIDKRMYRNACKYVLAETIKKFGDADYRVRELHALMFKDGWEGTFEMRCLIHAIVVGCPHTTQEQCEKARTVIEAYAEDKCEKENPNWKRGKCSHCHYLEGIKEKWEKKLSVK